MCVFCLAQFSCIYSHLYSLSPHPSPPQPISVSCLYVDWSLFIPLVGLKYDCHLKMDSNCVIIVLFIVKKPHYFFLQKIIFKGEPFCLIGECLSIHSSLCLSVCSSVCPSLPLSLSRYNLYVSVAFVFQVLLILKEI